MEIVKEIPSGAINGVNKVFSLLNTPTQIETVWLDGTLYLNFTLVGNVLTFVDAPITSVFVDYTVGAPQIVTDSTETFGDVKDEVWLLLGQKATSVNFSPAVIERKINSVLRQVWKGRVTSKLDPNRVYRAGDLWFTKGKFGIRAKGVSGLNADLALGDIIAQISTENLLPAGYVNIGGDVISYATSSATELQGISGLTMAHNVGEKVLQLYEVPDDFDRPSSVSIAVKGAEYLGVPLPYGSGNMCYNLLRSGNKTLIELYNVPQDSIITVEYQKRLDNLASDSDIFPLPEDYGTSTIAPLVAGELGFVKSLPNAQAQLIDGYTCLQNLYQYFTNAIVITKQTIRPIPYGRK